ncbi:MAG: lytic transglycosylase domain-containing protein [Candidatus Sulfotelmatobacter sp.]
MRQFAQWRLRLGVIALAVVSAVPCPAAESAVLRNGFAIRHERRAVIGSMTRLYVSADGASYVDIPTEEIDHFEAAPEEQPPESQASGFRLPASGNPASSSPLSARTGPAQISAEDLNQLVNVSSDRYRLDPDLVNSVIKAESGFNVRAVSPKGAQGLMQLMPGTATKLGVPNAFDPQANVEGGTKYLRELLELYNFDLVKALAAYNAGPQRVQQFGGVPPYYETKAYVARIVRDFNKKKIAQKSAAASAAPAAENPRAKKANSGTHSAPAKPPAKPSAKPKSAVAQAQAKSRSGPASD